MPRGFFFEYTQNVIKKLKYRYKCEHCGYETDWFESEILQSAKTIDKIKRMDSEKRILNSQKMLSIVRETAQHIMEILTEKIDTALLSENEFIIFKDEPFLTEIFNETFIAGKECPYCKECQSWYPAYYKPLSKSKLAKSAKKKTCSTPTVYLKPEIEWGILDLMNKPSDKAEKETEITETTGLINLREYLNSGVKKSEYNKILLQISDEISELFEQEPPVFVKKVLVDELLIDSNNELVLNDVLVQGKSEKESITSIINFIKETSGDYYKYYKRIILKSDKYEKIYDLEKKIEKISFSVGKAFIVFFIIMILFALSRIVPKIIGIL